MTTFRAHFDGRVLVPDGPVQLPMDCVLEVHAAPADDNVQTERPLYRLAQIASQFPDNPEAPTDGAEQHDHYLYGTPKRS